MQEDSQHHLVKSRYSAPSLSNNKFQQKGISSIGVFFVAILKMFCLFFCFGCRFLKLTSKTGGFISLLAPGFGGPSCRSTFKR
jgi:hypothetical protein